MTDPQSPPPSAPVPPYAPASPAAPPAPYQAPPGAYQVPVGGYAAPSGSYVTPEATPRRSAVLGLVSLVLALVAAVVTPIVAGVTSFEIGRRIPEAITQATGDVNSLAFLSPARDQVLGAELAFWAGTVLGVVAIVLGILAIVRKQGRGQGIAGLIVAVIAPMIFFVVVALAITLGGASGAAGLSA